MTSPSALASNSKASDIAIALCLEQRSDDTITVAYLTPSRFAAKPQVGVAIEQEWHSFALWLSSPSYADEKQSEGAWCPTALEAGIVKGGRGPVSLLVADVDECAVGAIEYTAEVLRNYGGLVVPTFNATVEKPKHRIVLRLSRPLAPDREFPLAWIKMAVELEDAGIRLDRGCKNVNRLYFACVTRSPSTWLGARILSGPPVDVDAMLKAARADAPVSGQHVWRPRPATKSCGDRYVAAAVRRARDNVRDAVEGGRHETLLRESYSLARFDFSERELAELLLGPFVDVAGDARRREGERAIRDAVAARRRSA